MMTLTDPLLLSLLGFALWTLALVLVGIVPWRVWQVLSGAAAANDFPADSVHGSPLYRRFIRAHLNCVEYLPVYTAVVVVVKLSGVESPFQATLGGLVLAARIAQSLAHVSSGSALAVNIRFTFYLVQIGAMLALASTLL